MIENGRSVTVTASATLLPTGIGRGNLLVRLVTTAVPSQFLPFLNAWLVFFWRGGAAVKVLASLLSTQILNIAAHTNLLATKTDATPLFHLLLLEIWNLNSKAGGAGWGGVITANTVKLIQPTGRTR